MLYAVTVVSSLAAVLLTGVMTGVFFAFAISVMPGLNAVPPRSAVAAMQAGGRGNAECLCWCTHGGEYKLAGMAQSLQINDNLHSVQRQLIELRIEHADMDDMIDRLALNLPQDDLALRRLKKRRLLLRDQIARLELELDPPTPA